MIEDEGQGPSTSSKPLFGYKCSSCGRPVKVFELRGSECPDCAGPSRDTLADDLTYAGFGIRFLAHVIDVFLLVLLAWFFFPIFGYGGLGESIIVALFYPVPVWSSLSGNLASSPSDAMLADIAVTFSFIMVFWVFFGATPGKLVLGLRIVGPDGNKIGPIAAIIRYVGYWASGIPFGAGYLLIAASDEGRGLHDYIARTHVVRRR